jgi:hypothetical protein
MKPPLGIHWLASLLRGYYYETDELPHNNQAEGTYLDLKRSTIDPFAAEMK